MFNVLNLINYGGDKMATTLKENKHLKLTVLADGPGGNFAIEALGFCMGHKRDEITVGDRIALVCTLSVNAFMGNIKMQLIMQNYILNTLKKTLQWVVQQVFTKQ